MSVRVFILEDMEERIRIFFQLLDGKDHVVCVARNYEEAIECVNNSEPFDIAFLDHDLCIDDIMCDPKVGGSERTGTDFAGWLANSLSLNDMPTRIVIHSMNPIGARAMKSIFNNAGHVNVDVVPFPNLVRRIK